MDKNPKQILLGEPEKAVFRTVIVPALDNKFFGGQATEDEMEVLVSISDSYYSAFKGDWGDYIINVSNSFKVSMDYLTIQIR